MAAASDETTLAERIEATVWEPVYRPYQKRSRQQPSPAHLKIRRYKKQLFEKSCAKNFCYFRA